MSGSTSSADQLPPPTGLQKVENAFERCRKFAINVLAICASGLIAYAVIAEVFSGSYLIEPIDVPAAFSKEIQDKDGVAAYLRDEIGITWHKVFSSAVVKPIVQNSDEPTINVSGTSFPLRYFASLVRERVPIIRPIIRISGQILPVDSLSANGKGAADAAVSSEWHTRLILRTLNSTSGPFFDEEGSYIDVIKHAAVATLAQIDPYAAAGAMAQGDEVEQQKALILVKSALNKSRAEERPPWQYRWLPFESDLPRGELTEANVLFQLRKRRELDHHPRQSRPREPVCRQDHGDLQPVPLASLSTI
jgi:hypothetical protein